VDALAASPIVGEVVVVDESSTDGSAEMVAGRPGVRVVPSPGVGFAVAMNAAVRAAEGELLLLLGSDAFVRPDTPERLLRDVSANPRLALCGAALVDENGRRAKTHHRVLTLSGALIDALGVSLRLSQEGRGLARVEAVFPNCVLARREALEEVGGFDERFRFYYEDMDLCRRLASAGWEQAVDWDAEATHVGGGSTREAGPRSWFLQYHRSRLVYLRKHYPRGWVLYVALWAPRAFAISLAWRVRAQVRRARSDAAGAARAREWAQALRESALPLS
jgi:GT2 family glycosyltransferase